MTNGTPATMTAASIASASADTTVATTAAIAITTASNSAATTTATTTAIPAPTTAATASATTATTTAAPVTAVATAARRINPLGASFVLRARATSRIPLVHTGRHTGWW